MVGFGHAGVTRRSLRCTTTENQLVIYSQGVHRPIQDFRFEEGVMLRNQTEAWFTDRTTFYHVSRQKKQNVR